MASGICCGMACLAMLAAPAVSVAGEDPVLGDRPLSEQLKRLQSENRGFQLRAARALAEAPEALRPGIVQKVMPLLKSPRENDRFVAAQVMGDYGPVARAAVPDLIPLLQGTQYERNRAAAAKALGLILKDAAPAQDVEQAARALTVKFNEDYDQYSDVRREAVRALGVIGPAARVCIPKLTRALTDYVQYSTQHQMVRQQAAWTCGRMGPLAAEHMDRLISMMHAEGHELPEIVEAIGRIGPLNDNVVMNIVDKMESTGGLHDWSAFKAAALTALEGFGAKAAPARQYLERILRDTPNNRVTIEPLIAATRALGAMGAVARDALPLLEKMKTYESHPHAEIPKAKHDLLHQEAEAAIARVGR
jgi:HEAT repeat protein